MEPNYIDREKRELEELLKKKVNKLKAFYSHAFVYVIGVIVFVLKEYCGAPFNFFPIQHINGFVMIIWTAVFLVSAIDVFATYKIFGDEWEARKLKSILEKKVKKTKMGVVMEINFNEEDRYYLAKKKVENIKGFYGNLTSYIGVNIVLIVVNLYTSPNHLWFYWPLLWWGIGVIFHGLKVFEIFPVLGKGWEERKIQELMEKEREGKNKWQ